MTDQSPDGGTAAPSTLEVVGAAIVDGDRCLAAQRGAGMAAPLAWEFPGGKVAPGESPEEALRREIREELGVEIEVGARLGRGRGPTGDRVIVLDVYLARIVRGAVRPVEHRDWGWFDAEALVGLDWAAPDVPVLPAVVAILKDPDRLRPS